MKDIEYIKQSKKTLALHDENQRTIFPRHLQGLLFAVAMNNTCDALKRQIFYKSPQEDIEKRVLQDHTNLEELNDIIVNEKSIKFPLLLESDILDIYHACLGLESEVGEISIEFVNSVIENRALDDKNMKEEIGDLLWYMAIICRHCGFTFEEAMDANIEKLNKKRYKNGFSTEKALNRNIKEEQKIFDKP